MKYKIEIRPEQADELVIYARERNAELERIETFLRENDEKIFGYDGDKAIKLNTESIFCFFTEEGKVFALTYDKRLYVKERLYRIEEIFSESFVKINQSCLMNVSKIKRFESSIGGSLRVVLTNGYKDYISRRQLKTVKRRLGI